MYRRSRSRSTFWWVAFLGIIAGIVFVMTDANRQAPSGDLQDVQIETLPSPTIGQADASVASLDTPVAPTPDPALTLPANSASVPQAVIMIPSAAVSARVIPVYLVGNTWDVTRLGDHVGHLQGTGWFDQPGNVVLSGHVERSDGRRGVFASLKLLQPGDTVIVEFEGQSMYYVVQETRTVAPEDLTPLYPTPSSRLTLITCDEYDFVSNSYRVRTVVVAERAS
jgi:LPXTG-site transpeptidase (sortase) family protein